MLNFEKYLSDFSSTIDLQDFFINFIIVTILSFVLQQFYIKYGRTISDRHKFASIFLPLALATLLIISVIKSSIALSLGLVGALSIVRFRAAIKDPEELTYLFLIIGLGIVGGANKPLLAILSFCLIIPMLYINSLISNHSKTLKGKSYINIQSNISDARRIVDAITPHLPYLELKRVDHQTDNNFYMLVAKIPSVDILQKIKTAIKELDDQAQISIVDQPDIIL